MTYPHVPNTNNDSANITHQHLSHRGVHLLPWYFCLICDVSIYMSEVLKIVYVSSSRSTVHCRSKSEQNCLKKP